MRANVAYAVTAVLQALVESATVLDFVSKQCDKTDTFLQFFGVSIAECTEECDRRPRCRSIMFMHGMKHCSLKDNVDDDVSDVINVGGARCMYLKKTDWVSSDLGPCNDNKCNDTETCVSSDQSIQKFVCLKSSCPLPQVIENAHLLSDIRTIGSTNRYICNKGFRSFGSPVITCNNKAIWDIGTSTVDFRCEQSCTAPKSSYTNAVLSRIEYVGAAMFKREVIHFTCGKDFQALGPTASSTCLNGRWNYGRVRCCQNGTKNTPLGHLCMYYTGQLESYSQFARICSERGLAQTGGGHGTLMKYMLNHHKVVHALMPEHKVHFENYYVYSTRLKECFERENITMTNATFDEKINFARDRNMTQGVCHQVSYWAPGEPNGGAGEGCIMRKTNQTGYPLYDIPCENLSGFNIGAYCQRDMPII